MQTASAVCPHCGADNPIAAAFCNACGKALASPASSILSPTTRADLETKAKTAASHSSKALLCALILQLIFGVGPEIADRSQGPLPMDLAIAVAMAMFACYLWSRVAPFNAALTAAGIFVGRHLIHAAINAPSLADKFAFKLIVIAVMAKSIYDAYRHKELSEQLSRLPKREPIDAAP